MDRITGVSGEVAAEFRVSSSDRAYGFLQTSAQASSTRRSAAVLGGFALHW
jgi:hypothetical protein